jgi:hypothetical protein
MKDLHDPALIWLKGILFLVIALVSCALVWLESRTVKNALFLAVGLWAFARAYYFAFYVIEHYVDPQFRYSGLGSLLRYILTHKKRDRRGR